VKKQHSIFAVIIILLLIDATIAQTGEQTEVHHSFVCTDYTQGKVFIILANGKKEWEYPAENCNDVRVLPNGNMYFNTGKVVKEVTLSKRN
jgi:hypothetical protein